MPYIILKRSDIPAATLQVLDLDPNTSQRNLIYDPPGQTKYVNPVQNDTVVLNQPAGGGTPINVYTEANGLGAWLATNVNNGTGAAATGTITALGFPAAPGDTFTVAGQVYLGAAVPRTPGSNDWDTSGVSVAALATEIAAAINDPLNGTPAGSVTTLVTAIPVAGVVTIDAKSDGTAGNALTLASAGVNLADSGPTLAGGVDADALTAAEINTSSADILDLYAFGDLTGAAGALTIGLINGVMVAGAITAAQLSEVLDLLAGRHYTVPAGTQIDATGTAFSVVPAVGAVGGPGFVSNSLRNIYNSGSLSLSFATGDLEGFRDSAFIYAGVAGTPNGEAVVVYNDNGTFYTP